MIANLESITSERILWIFGFFLTTIIVVLVFDLEHIILIYGCFLASIIGGLAGVLTNGNQPSGEGVFSSLYVKKRIIIALSIGFPTSFLAHKYITINELIIAFVWAAAFIADLALPHLRQLILKIFLVSVENTLNKEIEK